MAFRNGVCPASSSASTTTFSSRLIRIPSTGCPTPRRKALRIFAERYFPDAAGETLDMQVCMFTNTPDEHFIVDVHPAYPNVSIAAGFSAHGFKFCSVIGEIMADLALDGATRHNIDLFRLRRFAAAC